MYDILLCYVTVCNITLTLNPKFKNKKINRNENENKKNKINQVYHFQL